MLIDEPAGTEHHNVGDLGLEQITVARHEHLHPSGPSQGDQIVVVRIARDRRHLIGIGDALTRRESVEHPLDFLAVQPVELRARRHLADLFEQPRRDNNGYRPAEPGLHDAIRSAARRQHRRHDHVRVDDRPHPSGRAGAPLGTSGLLLSHHDVHDLPLR